jgi:beta-aspartyl-dipeptidase (metallo-type)
VSWTRELTAHGITAFCYTGGYHVPPTTLTGSVRGDIAYIDVVVGVGEIAISDHRGSHPSVHELVRVAGDAHVAGLMTGKAGILHLHVGDGDTGLEPVRAALAQSDLPARVFHPSHVNRRKALFEEACDLARGGSYVDVTAFPVGQDEDAWDAPAALTRYLDSGAPPGGITISSDGGGCLPVFGDDGAVVSYEVATPAALLAALGASVRSGLALAQALPAFTSNPARLLRLADKGRLAVGASADLLILDENLALGRALYRGNWYAADGNRESAT